MNDDMLQKHEPRNSRWKLFFIAFALIGGFFLIAEHQAHVIAFLPWLLLGGCVFMHMFMHGRHSHGGHRMEAPNADAPHLSATRDSSKVGLRESGEVQPGGRSVGLNESSATAPPGDHSHHHGESPS